MTGKAEALAKFKTPDEAFAELDELSGGYMTAQ